MASWNPPNGFDHIAYTLFVGLPGATDGATVMPQQNGALPDGMRWQLRARAHGWTNALFDSRGASASAEGSAITPAASIALGPGDDTVTFTFPASVLGSTRSLSGVRLYLNTWDYDGGYRSLTPQPGAHSIGGGDGRQGSAVDGRQWGDHAAVSQACRPAPAPARVNAATTPPR